MKSICWFELKKKLIIDFKSTATYYLYKEWLNEIIQKAMLNKQIIISNYRSNLTLKFLQGYTLIL